MATNNVNAATVVDALLNRTATTLEKQRVIDAYAHLAPPGSTSEVIAGYFLAEHRKAVKEKIVIAERAAAMTATSAQVDADYTPTP
jgi:hypothetical protein